MINELIENVEAYLRMNKLGDLSDKLTLSYIRMSLRIYKKQVVLEKNRMPLPEVKQ